MKDSLDILRTDYEEDSVAHYGTKGMKWRNRKKHVTEGGNGVVLGGSAGTNGPVGSGSAGTVSNNHGLVARKKNVTSGGNGVVLGNSAGTGPVGNVAERQSLQDQFRKKIAKTASHADIMKLAKRLKALRRR